jgi:hypothetical protein
MRFPSLKPIKSVLAQETHRLRHHVWHDTGNRWKPATVAQRKTNAVLVTQHQELPVPGCNPIPRPNDYDYLVQLFRFGSGKGRTSSERPMLICLEFKIQNALKEVSSVRPTSQGLAPSEPQWSSPDYDHLVDTYSGRVSSATWGFHPRFDDRINEWADANGIGKVVGAACGKPLRIITVTVSSARVHFLKRYNSCE